jgi:4-hydroxybenzoate polyprenyltransferase
MKRVTHWPQAFLGLTFNWGALLGWAAVHGGCDWSVVLPLYGSGVFLTPFSHTIYAHQDKKDDVRAGVKSTALRLADDTKLWLAGFGASTVGLASLSGLAAGQAAPFYVGVGAAGAHLAWQLHRVNLDDPKDCLEKFKSNSVYGGILFGGIVAGTLCSIPH